MDSVPGRISGELCWVTPAIQIQHGQTALARATHPPPESWRIDSSANGTGEMRHPVAFVCQFDRFFAGQNILPVFPIKL